MRRLMTAGLLTLALAGCSSMSSSKGTIQNREENDGVIFGSFVINVTPGPEHESGWAFLKGQKAEDATYSVIFARRGFNPIKWRYIITAKPEEETVFIKALPPGDYVIEKISKDGFTNLEVQLGQPTFRAVAGQTTYIGKISAHFTNRIMAGSPVGVRVEDTQQDTTKSLSEEHGPALFASAVKDLAIPN